MKYQVSTKYKMSWIIVDDMGVIQKTGMALQHWVGGTVEALKETLADKRYPVRLIPIEEVPDGNDSVTRGSAEAEGRPEEAGRAV